MLSAPKLRDVVEKHININSCPETIRKILRKNGLNGRVARKKSFVSTNGKRTFHFGKMSYLSKRANMFLCQMDALIFRDNQNRS